MLSASISTDARVRELPNAVARLLFTWGIAHADNCGRMRAEPAYVRAAVLPHEPDVTDSDVADWLSAMGELGLIVLYDVDGGRFLQFRAWEKHQRLDRMRRSDIPPPPAEPVVTGWEPGVAGSRSGREVEVNGSRNEVEVEGGSGNPAVRNQDTATPKTHPHPPHCVCEVCFMKRKPIRVEGGR